MKKLLLAALTYFALTGLACAAVDLNTASKEDLQGIKGIGPSKAKAIVEYRKKNGNFATLDDLTNVKGFGPKTIDKLRGELTVADAAAGAKKGEVKPEPAKAEKK